MVQAADARAFTARQRLARATDLNGNRRHGEPIA
jgi:hypothetical protein